jgi:hypothetical protein
MTKWRAVAHLSIYGGVAQSQHNAIVLLALIGILASLLAELEASNLDPVTALRAD